LRATDRIDHGANGAFAIRAGNVNRFASKCHHLMAHGSVEAAAP